MKAGTTTLFDHLAGHPAVAASSDKEPKYFARDGVYERGPDWYASLWDWDPPIHSIAMEASTHYSFRHEHPETAARMAAHPGEFRLVYLVREPVARVESHYHHAALRPAGGLGHERRHRSSGGVEGDRLRHGASIFRGRSLP